MRELTRKNEKIIGRLRAHTPLTPAGLALPP
jgi:hypothetical protein